MKWFIPTLMLVSLTGCGKSATTTASTDPVEFAKSTMVSLSNGDTTVQSNIDFDSLSMMGINIGAAYSKMPSDAEKTAFRTSFITSYSKSFKASGGNVDALKNWRLDHTTPPLSVVAVDGAKGTLYVTLTDKNGAQKMTGLATKK